MMVQEKKFDALGYWEQRLREHPGITGVGYLGLSPQFLEQQYRSRKQRLRLALKEYGLADLAGRSVLDVGSGTGIWLDFWHQYGAERVVGLDFAQASVDKLTVQFPDDLIVRADMSEKSLPLSDTMRFDVISAFDVLLHIVDPDGFRRAIANLARHCAPGGWLIISDPIIQGGGYVPPHSYAEHNIVRPLAEYRDILTANGFVINSVPGCNGLTKQSSRSFKSPELPCAFHVVESDRAVGTFWDTVSFAGAYGYERRPDCLPPLSKWECAWS